MTGYRVAMVDDHPSPVWGIERVLAECSDLEWAGAAPTVPLLVARVSDPHVVILDLRLADGTSPHENVARLHAVGAKVLVYTSGEYPDLLRSAASAGVMGVVLKSAPQDRIVAAVRATAQSQPVLGTEWAAAIDSDPDLGMVQLSPQLHRVLALYASGETSACVARHMGVQVDTVHEYLKRIREKYAQAGRPTHSKLDLYKRAVEDGWLPTPTRTPRARR